jgi:hypothetical protein
MAVQTPEEFHDHPARAIEPGPLRFPPPMHRYLRQPITRICNNALAKSTTENHCAHFVCHVMRWNTIPGAATCNRMTFADRNNYGVHIRVNEVFNAAPNRHAWPAGGKLSDPALVVATIASNVQHSSGFSPRIGEHSRKHIGIHYQGQIWHYSTAHVQVFADTPQQFRTRKAGDYGPTTVYFQTDLLRL